MNGLEQDTLHEWWIITAEPDVTDCVRRMHIPGKILVVEQAKHGTEAMFHVGFIGNPDEDYEFLVTLDALWAMGAKIYGMLPARKTPPEDN